MSKHDELKKFLKNARQRISPADYGLPLDRRRRSSGLRREEVATLAGMSVTWYTWFEQGRDVRVSARMLDSLSRVMKLSAEERTYLFALAQNRAPPMSHALADQVSPAVRHTLDSLSLPALIMSPIWDVVGWNWMVTRAFRDYSQLPPDERNLLRILLTQPEYQTDPAQYETMARRLVSVFRMDYSQSVSSDQFEAMIERLSADCPTFARLWAKPQIAGHLEGTNGVHNPNLGGITFQHTSYVVEDSPSLRLVIFAPLDGISARRLADVAAENPAWGVSTEDGADSATASAGPVIEQD